MTLFPQTFIDDLRLHANILQVVQEYVTLRKAGTSYKGLCPFHSEKTPSFQVHPEKGFFHCFGCGVGGDVIKFLELHEKVGFQDAVRMLAQKFGLPMPDNGEQGDQARYESSTREALLKMHEMAAAYFREQLASPAGARARQQLKERGVAEGTIDQLGLGYAPQSRDALKVRLLKQGFSPPLVVESGLVVQRDGGEMVDRFRNRLMVPICRDSGSVIAFGGRAMEPGQVPKYLNSPETAVYSKGRSLYGLNLTKAGIRKLKYVVLVEGYFDYAQVFQTNAAPVVASCGTALTPLQAQLLRRFTTRVVLNYDPDAAGESAVSRSCELLVREGFDVNVVALDGGGDPDTFIRQRGAEAYREKLRASKPYLEYLMDRAAQGLDFGKSDVQRSFLGKMLAIAAWLPEATTRDQFADKVAHRANITAEVAQSEFRKLAAKRQTTLSRTELPGLGEVKKAEKALIWWVFQRPAEAMTALRTLEDEDLQPLATRHVLELAQSLQNLPPEQVPSALIQRLSEGDTQLVTSIAAEQAPPAKSLNECVAAVRRLRLDRERAALQRQIDWLQEQDAGRDDGEIEKLYQRKVALLHQMEELT